MAKNRTAEEKRFGRELSERERAALAVGTDDQPDPGQPAPRGVYRVVCSPYPRLTIDTGLPAGPEAEAVARDQYRTRLVLIREGFHLVLELVK